MKLEDICLSHSLVEDAAESIPFFAIRFWWLGQAGFLVRCGDCLLAMDPYLTESAHRLVPPPWKAAEPLGLNAVLCSHNHSDHLDRPALPLVAKANPKCLFLVPAAEREAALVPDMPADRVRGVNVGDVIDLAPAVRVHVLASAHEELAINAQGEHHFLGFVLEMAGRRIYHSGDCVPYPGLADQLRKLKVDLALLPVNGRDEARHQRNIIGNFTFDEAAALCVQAGIPTLMADHFDMFAGNDVPRADLLKAAAKFEGRLQCLLPEIGWRYEVR